MKAILVGTDRDDLYSDVSIIDGKTIKEFIPFVEFKAKYGEDIANALLLKGDLDL